MEIACSSLQSLDPVPFDVFCSALAATHDSDLHIPDEASCILLDTHMLVVSCANASDESDIVADRVYLWRDFSSSRRVYLLFDILWNCNISDSWKMDDEKIHPYNEDR